MKKCTRSNGPFSRSCPRCFTYEEEEIHAGCWANHGFRFHDMTRRIVKIRRRAVEGAAGENQLKKTQIYTYEVPGTCQGGSGASFSSSSIQQELQRFTQLVWAAS